MLDLPAVPTDHADRLRAWAPCSWCSSTRGRSASAAVHCASRCEEADKRRPVRVTDPTKASAPRRRQVVGCHHHQHQPMLRDLSIADLVVPGALLAARHAADRDAAIKEGHASGVLSLSILDDESTARVEGIKAYANVKRMATKKQRKRLHTRRKNQTRGRFQDAMRSILDPNAPSAIPLRELWISPEAIEMRTLSRQRIMDGYPYPIDPDSGGPLTGIMQAADAWDYLETLHDFFVGRVQELVEDRGSAEWLWWLRRLRGQFDDVNDMRSTGPYVQGVSEALAAGISKPSSPVPNQPTFTFPLTPEALLDLAWLGEMAIMTYQLHATMKRCAKGQQVVLIPGEVPQWEPDDDLDDAIEEYDSRTEREAANLMQSVGVATPKGTIDPQHVRIGGLVPHWYSFGVAKPPPFAKADPPPFLFEWIDLDAVAPLWDQNLLTEQHVALIAVLWAAFNIGTREPEHALRRMTAPLQWGYMVTPTNTFLIPALEEMCSWIPQGVGRAVEGCWLPGSAQEILDVLSHLHARIWPPLCGNPIHRADDYSVIDLIGASRRLFSTLLRPSDGAGVNVWSLHFEQNVRDLIDGTPWRPPDALRPLIGRTIKRADGSDLTNIDALAYRNGRLLLVSCKSIAFTVPALGGEFAVTRNIVEKIQAAASHWHDVIATLRDDRSLLPVEVPDDVLIDGCVAFPSVPFYTDAQWRRLVFGTVPYLVSLMELDAGLSDD